MPVVINYQSNAEAAEETKRLVEEAGGQAELLPFDVSKKEEVDGALDQWETAHGLNPQSSSFTNMPRYLTPSAKTVASSIKAADTEMRRRRFI